MDDITISEALGISVLGLCVVFVMLILLMGVITLLSRVLAALERPKKAATADGPDPAPAVADLPEAPGSCGDVKLYNVSDRNAAMIMAIVADELQVPLNTLRFRSIREIDEGGDKA